MRIESAKCEENETPIFNDVFDLDHIERVLSKFSNFYSFGI